jgi:hypothetical protein
MWWSTNKLISQKIKKVRISRLWKECLDSDGEQFYKYQQNKIITSYFKSWKTKKFMTYGIGNPGPGLRQAQKCDWVKLVNGIPKIWEEQ